MTNKNEIKYVYNLCVNHVIEFDSRWFRQCKDNVLYPTSFQVCQLYRSRWVLLHDADNATKFYILHWHNGVWKNEEGERRILYNKSQHIHSVQMTLYPCKTSHAWDDLIHRSKWPDHEGVIIKQSPRLVEKRYDSQYATFYEPLHSFDERDESSCCCVVS